MSSHLKTSFAILTDTKSNSSITEEMGKYILISKRITLDVSVDAAFRTFLLFLRNEYSHEIQFLPETDFQSLTQRIGRVTYHLSDISFKKRIIDLEYRIGNDEFSVSYIFKSIGSISKIKIRHIARIGEYRWGLAGAFGKFDYKKEYKEHIKKLGQSLQYYIKTRQIMSINEYQEIESKYDNFILNKYNVPELKAELIKLITKGELNSSEKKQVKKINKVLSKVGFL